MNENKPVHADNVPTATERPRRDVSREQIAARAEKLRRERSCPAGSDEAIWLEAESQLQAEAEARPVEGTASRPAQVESVAPRAKTRSPDPTEASGTPPRSPTEPRVRPPGGRQR